MGKPIILGTGLAGISAALALAPAPVMLVSPYALGEGCSSVWAQGGIAAAVGMNDSAAQHAADSIAAGAGLNDEKIVRQVTTDGRVIIQRLIDYGVPFDRDATGALRLGLEAAHRKRRIVHVADATGQAVMQSLIAAARAAPSIEIVENATAQDIIVIDGRVAGVTLRRGDALTSLPARQIILATGGAAALWRDTTNPHGNWGSGLALAARAGATLGDLEFMQFHPTAIECGHDPMPLASEALRGEGAILVDENSERFVDELQPRDIVTRAIWQQIAQEHRVFLDARTALGTTFAARFPSIYALCQKAGLDPATAPIPIRPAAHYHMGGVVTDARGRTNVPGLWACGEVACTGLHGANRLASNSLLEAASFGARAAADIKAGIASTALSSPALPLPPTTSSIANRPAIDLRQLMSEQVGIIRNRAGLESAIDALTGLAGQSDAALVGLMIATAALRRAESRGAHYRSDFPDTQPVANRSFLRLSDLPFMES